MSATTLVVFDFDYTLAKTQEKIWIWSPRGTRTHNNKPYIPIHPSTLSKVTLADDEIIDDNSFEEFYRVNPNTTQPINFLFKLLKYYIHQNFLIWILSARPADAKNDIMKFIESCGVSTTSIEYYGLKNSSPQAKINFLKNNVPKYIQQIFIYEDNKYVIQNIRNYLNLKINTYFIEHNNNNIILQIEEN